MKFPYIRSNQTLRPIIPIKLKNGETEIGYHVLVDSGADLCLFDEEVGAAIGLNVRSGSPQEIFGVGGKVSIYYLHLITISVGGWEYKIKAGFMPQVGTRMMPYGLVGQIGFFENFVVKFDYTKEEIELKPNIQNKN